MVLKEPELGKKTKNHDFSVGMNFELDWFDKRDRTTLIKTI